MSYSSRVYRQRNAHSYDEKAKEPFFAKQNDTDKTTPFIREFNLKLKDDKRIDQIMLPMSDGITLCRVI